jgi:hypothetical protein
MPASGSSPTTITMSWSLSEFSGCEYNSVYLTTDLGVVLQNMLVNTTYTCSCPAYVPQNFKIVCTYDYPPIACFTWVDADGVGTGTLINFNAGCSTDDYGISLYEWDWNNDGVYDNFYAVPTTSHDYGDTAAHTVVLRVTDTIGQTHTFSDSTVQAITTISVNIPLFLGWNLITIPIQNNYWASTLAQNISGCQMVSWFDAVNQTFKTYIVGGPSTFDFPILDGYGYFVLVDQSSILNVSGTHIESVSIPLYIGWNMIGWYNASDTLASSLGGNISGCQMMSWFDAVNQTFKTYIVGGPSTFDFTVTAGMGLFVLVNTASVWHGEG